MESLNISDWRPKSFLVVAQIDLTRSQVEGMGISVDLEDGEETSYFRVSAGYMYSFFKMPENPIPGYALLCGDPGEMGWQDALDLFLVEANVDRSLVIWVPSDEE